MSELITEEKVVNPSKPPKKKWGFLFILIALLALISVLGYGYFQLAKNSMALAKNISDLQTQISVQNNALTELKNNNEALLKANEKNETTLAQQEKIMSDWGQAQKGNMDKWRVAEAQQVVKLANDELQFTQHIPLALALLKRANEILSDLQDPKLLDLRKAVATDIATLETTKTVDITDLYIKLTALNTQYDKLPLPYQPLKPQETSVDASSPSATWWRKGLDKTWQALQKIVIVKYNGKEALPLVLPDEKMFLYQNLHAQMENTLWAVLNGNAKVYRASLGRQEAWIKSYFSPDAEVTKTVLQQLQSLQQVDFTPPNLNLSTTLKLFDTYFTDTAANTTQQ